MSWRRVGKSLQGVAAHTLLLCFTLLLVLKLDHTVSYSWWVIFFPLWLFHVVVARGRFSLPAPSVPHDRHWAPCHAVAAVPLLIAFELLLCIYLESIYVNHSAAVNLKIVFLPLLAFEVIILIDNFRMCKALLPGDDESMSDEAIWETLPHFWVAISMVFFLAATLFTLLKLCRDVGALGWWDLFINYGIAECFAFLVCTKWSNPVIHRDSQTREESSSSSAIRYLDWNSGLVVPSDDHLQDRVCGLQDIGGHIMKIPIIVFQVLLCMKLEGTPPSARNISLPVVFSPIFLLQGAAVLFAVSRLVDKTVLLLRSEASGGRYFVYSSRIRDFFCFLHHGSRLLGWWSIDETSREEQARLVTDGVSGYNTFSGYPPEIVKKMPKKDLAEEVWRLQAALGEQTEITKFSQQEYERLQQNELVERREVYRREKEDLGSACGDTQAMNDLEITSQACDDVLKVRSGYIRGLGKGPKPSKSNASDATSRMTNVELRHELASTREELASTREELGTTREELGIAKEEIHKLQESVETNRRMMMQVFEKIAPDVLLSFMDK